MCQLSVLLVLGVATDGFHVTRAEAASERLVEGKAEYLFDIWISEGTLAHVVSLIQRVIDDDVWRHEVEVCVIAWVHVSCVEC